MHPVSASSGILPARSFWVFIQSFLIIIHFLSIIFVFSLHYFYNGRAESRFAQRALRLGEVAPANGCRTNFRDTSLNRCPPRAFVQAISARTATPSVAC